MLFTGVQHGQTSKHRPIKMTNVFTNFSMVLNDAIFVCLPITNTNFIVTQERQTERSKNRQTDSKVYL